MAKNGRPFIAYSISLRARALIRCWIHVVHPFAYVWLVCLWIWLNGLVPVAFCLLDFCHIKFAWRSDWKRRNKVLKQNSVPTGAYQIENRVRLIHKSTGFRLIFFSSHMHNDDKTNLSVCCLLFEHLTFICPFRSYFFSMKWLATTHSNRFSLDGETIVFQHDFECFL